MHGRAGFRLFSLLSRDWTCIFFSDFSTLGLKLRSQKVKLLALPFFLNFSLLLNIFKPIKCMEKTVFDCFFFSFARLDMQFHLGFLHFGPEAKIPEGEIACPPVFFRIFSLFLYVSAYNETLIWKIAFLRYFLSLARFGMQFFLAFLLFGPKHTILDG